MQSLNARPLNSKSFLRLFWSSTQGNMAVMAALFIGVLAVIVSGTLDIAGKTSNQKELQHIVDAAALAAAREMAVSAADQTRVQAVAESYVNANWNGDPAKTKAILDVKNGLITVHSEITAASLALIQEGDGKDTFRAEAVAEISGGGNVCIISLSKHDDKTIDLTNNSRLTAENCQVYSNSDHKKSFKVKDKAKVYMDFVCIAGGLDGDPAKLGGTVITDCPAIGDPLRDRPAPLYNPNDCVDNETKGVKLNKESGSRKLKPGVYCGGLKIEEVKAELEPGIYIIKGGELKVDKGGTLIADGVGFVLVDSAKLRFKKNSTIELHAPRDGPMAGLLFFERPPLAKKSKKKKDDDHDDDDDDDKSTKTETELEALKHNIQSDDMRVMVGTVYMPYGDFLIDGDNPVSDQSEYTVIIANSFQLKNGPNLIIRTNYHLSDVPLPQGVGAQDVTIRLKR